MYNCKHCNRNLSGLKAFVNHCSLHRNLCGVQFSCPVNNCLYVFSNYYTLKSHIRRLHQEDLRPLRNFRDIEVPLICNIFSCGKIFQALKDFLNHLSSHFSDGSGTSVPCPYEECEKSFSVRSSFSSHLSRKHRDACAQNLAATVVNGGKAGESHVIDNCLDAGDNCIDTHLLNANEQDAFLQSFALFHLKLQAKFLLPASTIQHILEEYNTVYGIGQQHKCAWLQAKLISCNVSDDIVAEVVSEFSRNDLLRNHAEGVLRSNGSRTSFFKSHFSYVAPIEIYLGDDEFRKKRFAYYVPIKQTLHSLLQQETVQKQYLMTQVQPEHKVWLEDFTDGEAYSKRNCFHSPKAIKLLLYTDAFEVANPLGSGRKKHKIHAVYYILGNLSPHNRSNIDQIQLVMLCRDVDFAKFPKETVYGAMMKDLHELETAGIEILGSTIRGSVFAICGDNLGQHDIGGFSTNFSTSQYFCRYCSIHRSQFRSEPFSVGEPRTVENYNDATRTQSFGVLQRSIFNSLDNFHVCLPGLAPCLAHDLFEGLVSKDIALFIHYFVKKKYFTYAHLNRSIVKFKYVGSDAKDKPVPVSLKGDKLSGQAVQNWCFLRLLPVLVGRQVKSHNDEVWQLMLQLREIVEYVVAPKISLDQVAFLKCLIAEYIQSRCTLFPSVSLIPKHHYLLHYADLILQFGPLIRVWTLRFESKHKYFKQCIRKLQNFKNVCKTASERHQLMQSYLSQGSLFGESVKCEQALDFDVSHYSKQIQDAVAEVSLSSKTTAVCHRLSFKGTEYQKGQFVVIGENEPVVTFGKIVVLFLLRKFSCNEAFAAVEICHAFRSPQFGLHCIQNTDDEPEVKCVKLDELLDYYPLTAYHLEDMLVVPLHHSIPSALLD